MLGKHTYAFLIIAIVVLSIGQALRHYEDKKQANASGYELVVRGIKGRWLYEIYQNGELRIRQQYIPGIPEKKHFRSSDQARKVGGLVLQRLKEQSSPVITLKDLTKNGIAH